MTYKRKPMLCDDCEGVVYLSHEEGVFTKDNFYCENCAEKLEGLALLGQDG